MSSDNPGMIVNGDTAAMASKSPAELLQEKHEREAHAVTVEDVVDEDDVQHPPPAAPSQATTSQPEPKGKETEIPPPEPVAKKPAPTKPVLDVRSEEAFPALGGGPKPAAAAPTTWGARKPNFGNGARPAAPGAFGPPKMMTMPGKHTEQIRFVPSQMLPRGQLKKPIADIVRDIDRKSKARLEVRAGPNGSYIFEGVGSVDAVRQALKGVAQQVGSKQTVRVPVPASARPHIIGRQGVVVQGIHDRTGARIQVPRPDDSALADDDDDDHTIDVVIEGDAVSAEMARREIEQIVKERVSNINIRLKSIPPELFPFIAGPHDCQVNELEEKTKTQIRVPRYDTWSKRPPPQEAPPGQVLFVPDPDKHIHIFGERTAAQEARAEIERRAQELQRHITLRQLAINRGQHQFIVGEKSNSLHDFLSETGCAIVLPPASDDTEFLTITGPADHIENGINRAMDLATSMQMASIDLSRQHLNAPAGPHAHARALTAYLQQRQVIRKLERLYDAHIVLPLASSLGPVTWEVYSRDGKNTIRARSDVVNLIQAHPPSRLVTVPVDRYYHQYLRSRSAPILQNDFGVNLVIPEVAGDDHVVLVYEGQPAAATDDGFDVPRRAPSNDEIAKFQKSLQEAQAKMLSGLGDQNDIIEQSVPVPVKYHEKLQKFITRDQANKAEDYIPVLVSLAQEQACLRGQSRDVKELASKIHDFAEEQARDELERGNITTFDFPQKFAHFLIGRKGENINKLRDEFDVDIKIENGKVEVKGPKAKAEAAKTRITALARKLEDETTHVLKIAPQYHRDLIGQRGSTVNRLQDRYNVRVQFPRAASSPAAEDLSTVDAASDVGNTRNPRPSQSSDEVIIRGPRKGADSTRDEILSLYQWFVDRSHTATVSVARSQIPSLIGQRGREMDKLRMDTGAQIDVPAADEPADSTGRVEIRLKGTKKEVGDAKKLLLQRSKDFDETVNRTIDVDKKYHRSLIGAGGTNIRKIVVEAGGPDARMVKFPRADSDETAIRLEGKEGIVNAVIAAIEEFVRQKEDQVVAAIDVPQSQHRVLIGRGGEARRQIESQFGIILDVPKQGSGRTDVKIKGPSTAVEETKAHIQSIIKEQHAETIAVPKHLHHAIAENGSFFRRLRNDHQVTVDHAGEQIPPRPSPAESRDASTGANTSLPLITDDPSATMDTFSWKIVDLSPPEVPSATIPWVLVGTPENVAKAKTILEKSISTASQQSATGYLILPDPKTYRFVVGPGGSQINAIRKRTNCKIQVPKDQALGEAIEIKGSKDNLEIAKDMILDAVKTGSNGAGRS